MEGEFSRSITIVRSNNAGWGFELVRSPSGHIVLQSMAFTSPARGSGLKEGSILNRINGFDLSSRNIEQVKELFARFTTANLQFSNPIRQATIAQDDNMIVILDSDDDDEIRPRLLNPNEHVDPFLRRYYPPTSPAATGNIIDLTLSDDESDRRAGSGPIQHNTTRTHRISNRQFVNSSRVVQVVNPKQQAAPPAAPIPYTVSEAHNHSTPNASSNKTPKASISKVRKLKVKQEFEPKGFGEANIGDDVVEVAIPDEVNEDAQVNGGTDTGHKRKFEQAFTSDDNEIEIIGGNMVVAADMPHQREACPRFPFAMHGMQKNNSNKKHCSNCYCYVCEVRADDCLHWNEHCDATFKNPIWKKHRDSHSSLVLQLLTPAQRNRFLSNRAFIALTQTSEDRDGRYYSPFESDYDDDEYDEDEDDDFEYGLYNPRYHGYHGYHDPMVSTVRNQNLCNTALDEIQRILNNPKVTADDLAEVCAGLVTCISKYKSETFYMKAIIPTLCCNADLSEELFKWTRGEFSKSNVTGVVAIMDFFRALRNNPLNDASLLPTIPNRLKSFTSDESLKVIQLLTNKNISTDCLDKILSNMQLTYSATIAILKLSDTSIATKILHSIFARTEQMVSLSSLSTLYGRDINFRPLAVVIADYLDKLVAKDKSMSTDYLQSVILFLLNIYAKHLLEGLSAKTYNYEAVPPPDPSLFEHKQPSQVLIPLFDEHLQEFLFHSALLFFEKEISLQIPIKMHSMHSFGNGFQKADKLVVFSNQVAHIAHVLSSVLAQKQLIQRCCNILLPDMDYNFTDGVQLSSLISAYHPIILEVFSYLPTYRHKPDSNTWEIVNFEDDPLNPSTNQASSTSSDKQSVPALINHLRGNDRVAFKRLVGAHVPSSKIMGSINRELSTFQPFTFESVNRFIQEKNLLFAVLWKSFIVEMYSVRSLGMYQDIRRFDHICGSSLATAFEAVIDKVNMVSAGGDSSADGQETIELYEKFRYLAAFYSVIQPLNKIVSIENSTHQNIAANLLDLRSKLNAVSNMNYTLRMSKTLENLFLLNYEDQAKPWSETYIDTFLEYFDAHLSQSFSKRFMFCTIFFDKLGPEKFEQAFMRDIHSNVSYLGDIREEDIGVDNSQTNKEQILVQMAAAVDKALSASTFYDPLYIRPYFNIAYKKPFSLVFSLLLRVPTLSEASYKSFAASGDSFYCRWLVHNNEKSEILTLAIKGTKALLKDKNPELQMKAICNLGMLGLYNDFKDALKTKLQKVSEDFCARRVKFSYERIGGAVVKSPLGYQAVFLSELLCSCPPSSLPQLCESMEEVLIQIMLEPSTFSLACMDEAIGRIKNYLDTCSESNESLLSTVSRVVLYRFMDPSSLNKALHYNSSKEGLELVSSWVFTRTRDGPRYSALLSAMLEFFPCDFTISYAQEVELEGKDRALGILLSILSRTEDITRRGSSKQAIILIARCLLQISQHVVNTIKCERSQNADQAKSAIASQFTPLPQGGILSQDIITGLESIPNEWLDLKLVDSCSIFSTEMLSSRVMTLPAATMLIVTVAMSLKSDEMAAGLIHDSRFSILPRWVALTGANGANGHALCMLFLSASRPVVSIKTCLLFRTHDLLPLVIAAISEDSDSQLNPNKLQTAVDILISSIDSSHFVTTSFGGVVSSSVHLLVCNCMRASSLFEAIRHIFWMLRLRIIGIPQAGLPVITGIIDKLCRHICNLIRSCLGESVVSPLLETLISMISSPILSFTTLNSVLKGIRTFLASDGVILNIIPQLIEGSQPTTESLASPKASASADSALKSEELIEIFMEKYLDQLFRFESPVSWEAVLIVTKLYIKSLHSLRFGSTSGPVPNKVGVGSDSHLERVRDAITRLWLTPCFYWKNKPARVLREGPITSFPYVESLCIGGLSHPDIRIHSKLLKSSSFTRFFMKDYGYTAALVLNRAILYTVLGFDHRTEPFPVASRQEVSVDVPRSFGLSADSSASWKAILDELGSLRRLDNMKWVKVLNSILRLQGMAQFEDAWQRAEELAGDDAMAFRLVCFFYFQVLVRAERAVKILDYIKFLYVIHPAHPFLPPQKVKDCENYMSRLDAQVSFDHVCSVTGVNTIKLSLPPFDVILDNQILLDFIVGTCELVGFSRAVMRASLWNELVNFAKASSNPQHLTKLVNQFVIVIETLGTFAKSTTMDARRRELLSRVVLRLKDIFAKLDPPSLAILIAKKNEAVQLLKTKKAVANEFSQII